MIGDKEVVIPSSTERAWWRDEGKQGKVVFDPLSKVTERGCQESRGAPLHFGCSVERGKRIGLK